MSIYIKIYINWLLNTKMELYTKVMQQCTRYGCSFKHTVGQNCKLVSRCGHETIVSVNCFMKYKIGVYCTDCMEDIMFSGHAECINCLEQFKPTETKFLFCSASCGSSISMTDERKQQQREKLLKKTLEYVNDDGSLKSLDEIDEIKKSKKRKSPNMEMTIGENTYSIVKKGKFVEFAEIKSAYETAGCKLLTTEEEYIQMKQIKQLKYMLFDVISLCGHQEKSLYYSFTMSNTCLYCKRCTLIRARETLIGQAKTDDGYGNSLMTQKLAIDIIKQKCAVAFRAIKTRDGCDSDLLVIPHGSSDNCWLKLKIKSTINQDGNIFFRISKIHQSIYLLVSIATHEIWMFDPTDIKIRTYYMKQHKDVYNDNIIKNDSDLISRLQKKYTDKKYIGTFDELNDPISPAMKVEYKFVLKRERTIDFFKFDRNEITGAVYNFKIGNLKFQESVVSKQTGKNSFVINMSKNSRQKTKKPYDIGDNDFYWINLNDTQNYFYVIPEHALVKFGFIQTPDQDGTIYLSISVNQWLEKYKFTYDTINTENEKQRLISLVLSK